MKKNWKLSSRDIVKNKRFANLIVNNFFHNSGEVNLAIALYNIYIVYRYYLPWKLEGDVVITTEDIGHYPKPPISKSDHNGKSTNTKFLINQYWLETFSRDAMSDFYDVMTGFVEVTWNCLHFFCFHDEVTNLRTKFIFSLFITAKQNDRNYKK